MRQYRVIYKETRLCMDRPGGMRPPPESAEPMPLPEPKNWIERLKQSSVNLYYSATDFITRLPGIREFVDNLPPIKNEETLRKLFDHGSWLKVYVEQPGLLTVPVTTPLPTNEKDITPEAVLRSKPLPERQMLYAQYIDRFIPKIEQIKLGIGGDSLSQVERLARITDPDKQRVVNAVLTGIFGIEVPDPADPAKTVEMWRTIARPDEQGGVEHTIGESLRHYFKDPLTDAEPGSEFMFKDVEHVLNQTGVIKKHPSIATSPSLLEQRVNASPLKGALQRGVITEADLTMIYERYQADHQTALETSHTTNQRLEQLTRATERQNRVEARGMKDIFMGMGGLEKLALIGGLLFLATRKNWLGSATRGAAMAITGAYFFQKFVMKQDDPFKVWDGLLGKTSGAIKRTNESIFGDAVRTPGYVETTSQRAGIMTNFLMEFDRENLDTQVEGFSLIADTPLNILAKHFDMGKDGQQWHLQVENPVLDKEFRRIMEANNWDKNACREFFANPENTAQVTEGLGYVFYLLAKRDPANDPDVRLVERVRGQLPAGYSLARIGQLHEGSYDFNKTNPQLHQKMLSANESYIRLVRKGREVAAGTNMSLKDLIAESIAAEAIVSERSSYEGSGTGAPPDDEHTGRPHIPGAGADRPDIPGAGADRPDVPGAGAGRADVPGVGAERPEAPGDGADRPGAPDGGVDRPGTGDAGAGRVEAPGGGTDRADAPGGGADASVEMVGGAERVDESSDGTNRTDAPRGGDESSSQPESGSAPSEAPGAGTNAPGN